MTVGDSCGYHLWQFQTLTACCCCNNECWAGNNWSRVSRLGSTSCEKDGGINKIHVYSVGNSIPDNYASNNAHKCANYGGNCECDGYVKMAPKYRAYDFQRFGYRGNPGEWKRGERDFNQATPYKVVKSNGSVKCDYNTFGGNWPFKWGNNIRGAPLQGGITKPMQCWCMNDKV